MIAFRQAHPSTRDDHLYVKINGQGEDRTFTVQEDAASDWRRALDTAKASPEDIVEPAEEPKLAGVSYVVRARSAVVLRKERA